MATWYEATWDSRIKEVDVVKETKDQIMLQGETRKKNKRSETFNNYFPTREEAVDFILARQFRKVQNLQTQLKQEEEVYGKLKNHYCPE